MESSYRMCSSVSFLYERFFHYDFSLMSHLESGRVVQSRIAVLIRVPFRFCLQHMKETGTSKTGSGFVCGINSPNNPIFNRSISGWTYLVIQRNFEAFFWEICFMWFSIYVLFQLIGFIHNVWIKLSGSVFFEKLEFAGIYWIFGRSLSTCFFIEICSCNINQFL